LLVGLGLLSYLFFLLGLQVWPLCLTCLLRLMGGGSQLFA
jgi:hypothetical protein